MGGLAKICKIYGSMKFKGKDGEDVIWLWDYKNNKPRLKSEMTKDDISESEKAKWEEIKKSLE